MEKYAIARLPTRPQDIGAGTLYFAELQEPLDFGSEPTIADKMSTIGTPRTAGTLVHALLGAPLDSASTQKERGSGRVLSRPLFNGDHLILPQGSRLKGLVGS